MRTFRWKPFNSNALALTIIGAFLGEIVGHAISPIVASKGIRRILRINAEPIGFDTALLMLLTANAIWVAAELIYTIFQYNSRDITKVITTIVIQLSYCSVLTMMFQSQSLMYHRIPNCAP